MSEPRPLASSHQQTQKQGPRRHALQNWVVALLLAAGSGIATADDAAPDGAAGIARERAECAARAVERIQRRYESIRDLSARFEQTTESISLGGKGLANPEPATGRVRFAKPGRMRWFYETPAESQVVTDGQQLWIYDPGANEVQRLPAAHQYLSGAALQFLLGDGRLAEEFDVRATVCELGNDGPAGRVELELVPRAEATYERLELEADGASGDVRASRIVDLFGNVTRIAFTDVRVNQDLPAELFHFEPPAGTEVIDLISPGSRR